MPTAQRMSSVVKPCCSGTGKPCRSGTVKALLFSNRIVLSIHNAPAFLVVMGTLIRESF